MAGVLSGLRVLDFGRYVAGPYCATLLGLLGAEIIRVERPGGGEDRSIAPLTDHGDGAVFMQTGCNKRSICLRPGRSGAAPVVARLVASADVVVTNFPDATLRRLALDLQSLRRHRADIILANVSAFGSEGPMVERGGFDGVGQAMSGAMYMTGLTGQPAKAAAPYVDYTSAVLMAFGVLAALRERDQSGRGQQVSTTLLGTALAVFNSHLIEQGVLELDRVGSGNRVQTSAPSDVFATRDGHILIHCPGDAIFKRCAELIGRTEWLDDERFATDQGRGDHRDLICAPMLEWCAARTTDQALEALAAVGIPAGPVLTPREALAHDQVQALGLLQPVDYPGLPRPAPVAALPLGMSVSEHGIRSAPAAAGQHTDEVLGELGFDAARIGELRQSGVIG